ncbi:heme oxygenase-like protein [Lentinula aciculospora]|uniref:Heme oxygenase-like protein n=1 Tax=Lentinula aciculospora TaxID=153920 RepID=A0A9W9AQV8_9AGAR|nr:heme oxygenase-like protein [Lentinula aciculospora]KAJ4488520.1 heme oxygenase-like protein [Lentinula aciculospora]
MITEIRNTLKSVLNLPTEGPRASLTASLAIDEIVRRHRKDATKAHKMVSHLKSDVEPQDIEINKMWRDPHNKDVVSAFMNNKLCVEAARGDKDALEAYKRYAVQDYFYLLDSVKFMALRLAKVPFDDFDVEKLQDEADSVAKYPGYANDWFKTCVGELGLSADDFRVERTIAEIAYSQYLMHNAQADDWYNLHVILIGCYWGWCKLAVELYKSDNTDKNTIFYKNWILPNIDLTSGKPEIAQSAKTLSKFLDMNVGMMTSGVSRAQGKDLFRTALRLETSLFNSGYEDVVRRSATGI